MEDTGLQVSEVVKLQWENAECSKGPVSAF